MAISSSISSIYIMFTFHLHWTPSNTCISVYTKYKVPKYEMKCKNAHNDRFTIKIEHVYWCETVLATLLLASCLFCDLFGLLSCWSSRWVNYYETSLKEFTNLTHQICEHSLLLFLHVWKFFAFFFHYSQKTSYLPRKLRVLLWSSQILA